MIDTGEASLRAPEEALCQRGAGMRPSRALVEARDGYGQMNKRSVDAPCSLATSTIARTALEALGRELHALGLRPELTLRHCRPQWPAFAQVSSCPLPLFCLVCPPRALLALILKVNHTTYYRRTLHPLDRGPAHTMEVPINGRASLGCSRILSCAHTHEH
jgi:hypothetical protein